MQNKEIIVAITGASGGAYALRLIDCLESAGVKIDLIVSERGRQILADECQITDINSQALIGRHSERIAFYDFQDVGCRLASGSHKTDGMVICPCSSHTLGSVAAGLGDTLVTRAAHVTMKECRRLVLLHREMPLSAIVLENMLRLQRAGVTICPAAPGFYMKPETIQDLVDFVVGRVLDLVGVNHKLRIRWGRE